MSKRPLHAVALYNPELLSRDELVQSFVVREVLLERLLSSIRRTKNAQPQHALIVGRRGMGKSTLLRRIRYAIEDDKALAKKWMGLNFPEEQYNVSHLSDFWLNCVDALADTLEIAREATHLDWLDGETERVQAVADEEGRQRAALKLLTDASDRLRRRFVLLVDNLDLVVGRLKEEEWELRRVLSEDKRLMLIGATANGLESSYRYDMAFYDFFRIHSLSGLDAEETLVLMRRLSELHGADEVGELLDTDPGRIQTIRVLSGGNPRTIVLLFSLLAQGVEGDVRSDLERLLDQCTPLYKHRFESLADTSQRMVDALALHWHPATASQLADATRESVNLVSSQLSRLVKDGVVEKVSLPNTKRLGFQIAERFFNIWYLMRSSRRVRRKMLFLVEFLRLMFAQDDLQARASGFLQTEPTGLRSAEYGRSLALAIDDKPLRAMLENSALHAILDDPATRDRLHELFDLEGEDAGIRDEAERVRVLASLREQVYAAKCFANEDDRDEFWRLLSESVGIPLILKTSLVSDLDFEKCEFALGLLSSALVTAGATRPISQATANGQLDLAATASAELNRYSENNRQPDLPAAWVAARLTTFIIAVQASVVTGSTTEHRAGFAWILGDVLGQGAALVESSWPVFVRASVVATGHGVDVRLLLKQHDLDQRWQPLDAALAVIEADSFQAIADLAPEIQTAAKHILEKGFHDLDLTPGSYRTKSK